MSEIDFTVTTAELEGSGFVVSVAGEPDLHNASELARALEGVLALGGTAVAVDLTEVVFIDSASIAILLRFQPRFQSRGGTMILVSDDRRLRRILEITGVDRLLAVERRLSDAVAALGLDGRPSERL